MDDLASALLDAGGVQAPRERAAQLRSLLAGELVHGRGELSLPRSGRERPVLVAFAAESGLAAVTPAPSALRADPQAAEERTWLLVAAAVGALVEIAPRPLRAGDFDGNLVLAVEGPATGEDTELAAPRSTSRSPGWIACGRVRSRCPDTCSRGRCPSCASRSARRIRCAWRRPLRVWEAGPPTPPPAGPSAEAVLVMLAGDGPAVARPHDDPEPARRVARRVLQRLDGMGK